MQSLGLISTDAPRLDFFLNIAVSTNVERKTILMDSLVAASPLASCTGMHRGSRVHG